ncbi:MAG: 50S ribosomal protein L35 [Candidatus Kerfeldbacteria bacterium RIFCSPLOWO2_01_FULL_48_11]|uniref:Large ribosomal subunit protein bL35 n=1 Tax=Candidatus Kerfeldbacteria bacterium RIFCSPLOWO2_01_FULL_48_11 TaxID=1798543 RepID=A0A1G2B375_9BACT|nr:MAG: 50S ribosomal protein L35 [Parcubacteria group bacterium GW2011_GWA2_48_9]KKW15722.1 MAG: 50S ribosomal protein L35 [Parcubacteria group bacterium GW2011_GWC2_49_9]OGY83653.1 MAG: 50S ribosomal protein L35 [Candidatus Kerfeldbacteria bacterium RIFCSPLOWO2_01_FULL_48_11]HCM68202.1 50S ribosomal protein L35 [Candidatus Kerfeldbacteria bacterium]
MPKLKTHKATTKRYWKTKNGKILRRKSGQDHFNARESGNITRSKRRDVEVNPSFKRTVGRMIPY